jgi:integrase
MFSVYTRHYPPCIRTDTRYRRCRCPKWIRGFLRGVGPIRRSAHTRTWAEAEQKTREMAKAIAIKTAAEAYLNDERGRRLKPETLAQKKAFIKGQLLPWCEQRGLVLLDQIQLSRLQEFRQSWDVSAATAGRREERLRSFFAFCLTSGWLRTNPTDALKKPVRAHIRPTNYFNRKEFQQIAACTEDYEYGGGLDCRYRGRRMLALVLLMRWSGLSIKDAVALALDQLDEKGALFLRRAKTGTPVFVPLPPFVVSLLRTLPPKSPNFFFWSGNGDVASAVKGYQRSFRKLFRIAGIRNPDGTPKRCHSHMFRDTFAVELLLAGVPIDQVSVLLGHRSVKMTEKHYLPWVRARQKQLTASVRHAWFPDVRQAPVPQGREAEHRQTCLRAARSHWFRIRVDRNPVAHPFFPCA